ncbi:MAG: hypothetical protein GY794_16745 [bacterium]|nr:hypothetical protein [bacterium]
MNKLLRPQAMLSLVLLMAVSPNAWAQERAASIGYIYPAGGRQGSSFDVTIGGQFLTGVSDVYISGKGVEAEIVKYIKPISKKHLNELRTKLRELRKALPAADRKKGFRHGYKIVAPKFNAYAKKLGLEDMDLDAFVELGKKLRDPKRQPNVQIAELVLLKIKIAPDAEPGHRELRLKTPKGLSNPRLMCVGVFKECSEAEPNNKNADASKITALPTVINGQILPGDVDRFVFKANKGTRLIASAAARELIPYLADAVPGWFQATLTLYDDSGQRVAYTDDYQFRPDPVLRYEIPRTGNYTLEIKDAIYRGREDFVYRITLGATPFVASVFPLGGQVGTKTNLQLTGWNLPSKKITVDNKGKLPGIVTVSVGKGVGVSNSVPFALSDLKEVTEVEPNNNRFGAQNVKLPVVVNGRMDRPGDWDVFSFKANAGDEIVAHVQARSLGTPLDSMLKLTDARGKTLAINDDYKDKGAGLITHHADSRVIVKIPADGTYTVQISDTQNKGGEAYVYRLRIGIKQPDFELRVVPSGIHARGGTVVPITVYAMRKDGFSGSISLKLVDAPKGFELTGATIPAGQNKLKLTLTLPYLKADKTCIMNLEGRSVVNGRDILRRAVPAEDMMQAFLYRHLVTTKSWMIVVSPKARWKPLFKPVDRGVIKLSPGKTTTVRFTGYRIKAKFKIRLELDDPPDGVTIGKIKPSTDKSGGIEFVLTVDPSKARAGTKGNLIVKASTIRSWKRKNGTQSPPRVIPMGVLPAIPFEITGKPKTK